MPLIKQWIKPQYAAKLTIVAGLLLLLRQLSAGTNNNYTKAIQLKPQYADAYINRGNAYGKSGNYQRQ